MTPCPVQVNAINRALAGIAESRYVYEHATDAEGGKQATRAGWMTKQGSKRKSWKRRWFSFRYNDIVMAMPVNSCVQCH